MGQDTKQQEAARKYKDSRARSRRRRQAAAASWRSERKYVSETVLLVRNQSELGNGIRHRAHEKQKRRASAAAMHAPASDGGRAGS